MKSQTFVLKSALNGRSLEMICINSTQIYLHFGLDTHVSIEGVYGLTSAAGTSTAKPPHLLPDLTFLLDKKVVDVEFSPDQNLRIVFENWNVIEIIKDENGYESFKVNVNKKEIIIV